MSNIQKSAFIKLPGLGRPGRQLALVSVEAATRLKGRARWPCRPRRRLQGWIWGGFWPPQGPRRKFFRGEKMPRINRLGGGSMRQFRFVGNCVVAAVFPAVNHGDTPQLFEDRIEGFDLLFEFGAEGGGQVALQEPADDFRLSCE